MQSPNEQWQSCWVGQLTKPVLHSGLVTEWVEELSIAGQKTSPVSSEAPVLFAKSELNREPVELGIGVLSAVSFGIKYFSSPSPTFQSPDLWPQAMQGQYPEFNSMFCFRLVWPFWQSLTWFWIILTCENCAKFGSAKIGACPISSWRTSLKRKRANRDILKFNLQDIISSLDWVIITHGSGE